MQGQLKANTMTTTTPPPELILETNDLSFAFRKEQPILSSIRIGVPKGSIYGFLGPNGAGKTTTMRLLTGLLPQQGHHIRFFGQPLEGQLPALFHRIGSLIETPSLYLHLSGLDNLRLVARMRGLSEKMAAPALEWVGLQNAARRRARQYSLGMKQRLAIAMALLNEPELLMLDEPVNGLDPAGMVEIRELLKELNYQKGITIFISSHLLYEVEKMCSHIGIIHRGQMRFEGTIEQLAAQAHAAKRLTITLPLAAHWVSLLQAHYEGVRAPQPDKLQLTIPRREEAARINKMLVEAGADVYELRLHDSLEEWFMEMTAQ